MRLTPYIRLIIAAGVLVALAGFAAGCRTEQRKDTPATTSAPSTAPVDSMARSDAERAQADIDRNQREMSGERRPRDPARDRVVDQPPATGRRR